MGHKLPMPPCRPACSAACTADVLMLQEVWVAADVELLRQAGAEGGLPHSFQFLSGAVGSGLLLLSRFRIVQAAFHPFTARGDPFAVTQGDFFAGKGRCLGPQQPASQSALPAPA
jgi:sphingomyelin phosphodiesterase 2